MNGFLLIFVVHCMACFSMTGIMWFVQLVHYPMIAKFSKNRESLETFHYDKTMPLAVPMIILETLTGFVLLFLTDFNFAILNLVLIIGTHIATFNYCVPSHCDLKKNYTGARMLDLMSYHATRTWLWTARSLLLGYLFYSSIILP